MARRPSPLAHADSPPSLQPASAPAKGKGDLSASIAALDGMTLDQLRLYWRNWLGGTAPPHLPRWLLMRLLAWRIQAQTFGDLDRETRRAIGAEGDGKAAPPFARRVASTREGLDLKPGSLLTREWRGQLERVMVLEDGFAWDGGRFGSLSLVAKAITGTSWNGHRFFGLKPAREKVARQDQLSKRNGASGVSSGVRSTLAPSPAPRRRPPRHHANTSVLLEAATGDVVATTFATEAQS